LIDKKNGEAALEKRLQAMTEIFCLPLIAMILVMLRQKIAGANGGYEEGRIIKNAFA
jgi:hypothetical protein